jgi:hypothetical protein
MSKLSELFDSFTWNATLSLVSLAMLAYYLVSMIAARSFAPGGVLFVVWIVIAYHFISVAYKQYKEKLRQGASDE